MQRSSSLLGVLIICLLGVWPASNVSSATGSVADLAKWDVTSYQVKLLDHRGGSGDIQSDQNGWIHLGANHLEGGDIKYEIQVGRLSPADILEVWVDGYSTSNDLNTGPTVFIGTGKNRSEQITRVTGDAWRPFVFRFADDALYGDVTDPSNRNENWRSRYPSSKYEVRRIDKGPQDLLADGMLPLRLSMTGTEDFIIKRVEVVVYRTKPSSIAEGYENVDLKWFDYVQPSTRPVARPTPKVLSPAVECAPTGLPPIPQAPPAYRAPSAYLAPPTYAPPAYAPPMYRAPAPVQTPYPRYLQGNLLRGYTIQIAAFRTQSAAMATREKLRRNGYDVYIVESVEGGSRLFRVRVGHYQDKSLALRDADRLRQHGFDTWITDLS